MSEQSVVAVYPTVAEAEQAVRALAQARFPIEDVSLVAKEFSQECRETDSGHARHLPKLGFRIAIGAALVSFPGRLAGSLVSALTGVKGTIAGGVITDIVKALGAKGKLASHLLGYDEAVKAGKFVVIAHGSSAEVEQAREILLKTSPMELTLHREEG
jgi:hypothetical protein